MKKIFTILALTFLVSTAEAVITPANLVETRLVEVRVKIPWNQGVVHTSDIRIEGTAIVVNANGKRAGVHKMLGTWGELSATQKTNLGNFLKFVSRKVNNDAIAEDVELTIP